MYEIMKEYGFEAAHQLPNHDGKCRRLHGHSYKTRVWLRGPELGTGDDANPKEGMLYDFANVSDIVKPIIDAMDHRFLGAGDEPILFAKIVNRIDKSTIISEEFLLDPFEDVYPLGVRSTAENIAKHIFDKVLDALLAQAPSGATVVAVEVAETATSWAVYRG